jgi:uncharacterized membrane protein YjjP (DUF1212 family)
MKKLKQTFDKIQHNNPYYTSWVCFVQAIEKRNYNYRILKQHFNILVDKGEYDLKDKTALLQQLYNKTRTET